MRYVNLRLFACLALLSVLFSCKKDPANPPGSTINLEAVRMNDFSLEETAYSNISITHPVITNGVETQQGEIRVTVPPGTTQLRLTPKVSNFTTAGYNVSPRLGQQQNFLNKPVVYTIASTQDASKLVHYIVTITEAQQQPDGGAVLTSFRFEKAKNPFLPGCKS